MKATLLAATLLFFVLNPAFATVSTRRPSQTTLKARFKIPVTVAGKESGWIIANTGTVVDVDHMRRDQIMIRIGNTTAWIKRSDTDFDQRLAAFKATKQQGQAALTEQNAKFEEQKQAAAADFQQQHAAYDNPLNKGAYDQQRALPEYYDRYGRRYHMGVFGQRIYD